MGDQDLCLELLGSVSDLGSLGSSSGSSRSAAGLPLSGSAGGVPAAAAQALTVKAEPKIATAPVAEATAKSDAAVEPAAKEKDIFADLLGSDSGSSSDGGSPGSRRKPPASRAAQRTESAPTSPAVAATASGREPPSQPTAVDGAGHGSSGSSSESAPKATQGARSKGGASKSVGKISSSSSGMSSSGRSSSNGRGVSTGPIPRADPSRRSEPPGASGRSSGGGAAGGGAALGGAARGAGSSRPDRCAVADDGQLGDGRSGFGGISPISPMPAADGIHAISPMLAADLVLVLDDAPAEEVQAVKQSRRRHVDSRQGSEARIGGGAADAPTSSTAQRQGVLATAAPAQRHRTADHELRLHTEALRRDLELQRLRLRNAQAEAAAADSRRSKERACVARRLQAASALAAAQQERHLGTDSWAQLCADVRGRQRSAMSLGAHIAAAELEQVAEARGRARQRAAWLWQHLVEVREATEALRAEWGELRRRLPATRAATLQAISDHAAARSAQARLQRALASRRSDADAYEARVQALLKELGPEVCSMLKARAQ